MHDGNAGHIVSSTTLLPFVLTADTRWFFQQALQNGWPDATAAKSHSYDVDQRHSASSIADSNDGVNGHGHPPQAKA